MGLGQFVKPDNQIMHDKIKARDVATAKTPMLVYVREYKAGMTTEFSKNGDGEGVSVDFVDLSSFQSNPEGSVYCNVLWMGKAVRDQLRLYAGQDPLAIRLAWAQGGSFGQYIVPEPIEDDWLQWANYIVLNYPEFVNQTKANRLAAWQAEHPDAPVQQAAPAPQAAPALPTVTPSAPVPQAAPPAPPAPAPQAPAPAAPAPPVAVAAPPAAAPVAPPAFSQAPVAAPPQAPVAAPPAPPPAPPAVPQAPAAPPAPPAAPVAAAPGQVADQDVDRMLAELEAN